MLSEVLDHFGFTRDLHAAGYYETPYHRQFLKNLLGAVYAGRLIAFTGLPAASRSCSGSASAATDACADS